MKALRYMCKMIAWLLGIIVFTLQATMFIVEGVTSLIFLCLEWFIDLFIVLHDLFADLSNELGRKL